MIEFLTTPIFYLTPYIFLWSIINGLITLMILKWRKLQVSTPIQFASALTTATASTLWNWSIEFNKSTIYLNVDHPNLRISWADALNGVCVFALTSFVLGFFISKTESAKQIAIVAGIAAVVTIITDTFLF